MKKFGLLSIMLVCIFLVGCSNYQKSVTITNQETKKQQVEFDMKEKCAKYYDDFIKSVEKEYNIPVVGYIVNNQTFVFYSSIRNSCIGASYVVTDLFTNYNIQDLLTHEELYSNYCPNNAENGDEILNCYNPYKTEIYNLQGYPDGYCREIGDCYGYGLVKNTKS